MVQLFSRMKSSIQNRYEQDGPGSRTGGGGGVRCSRAQSLDKLSELSLFGLACTSSSLCSVWPTPEFDIFGLTHTRPSVCSVRPRTEMGKLRLVHTSSLVCLVWPVPNRRSLWSVSYLIVSLFGLAQIRPSSLLCGP